MFVKNFYEFINESYLKGSRAPLFHFTSRLKEILKSDKLKVSKPSRSTHKEKSISLTRNIDYQDVLRYYCIELDSDKLYNNGYVSYPVDELGWSGVKLKHKGNYIKSNFDSIKKGKRGTKHNLNLPKGSDIVLETEFEERIYKDINNIGKYIIAIYINIRHSIFMESDIEEIKNFLTKYPHIKILKVINNDFRNTIEITHQFKDEHILIKK